MPRRRLPILLLVLLSVTWCAACDEGDGEGGQSVAKHKNGKSHGSKKDKGRDKDEPPKAEFKLGRLDKRMIPESSGLIASRKHPGVFWTHNDSGNGPAVFAVSREGKLLAWYTVNGVRNTDWESITTDDEGHLYVGDTGNNEHQRDRVAVYQVDEPDPKETGASGATVRINKTWRLQYPDKPFDSESLFLWRGKAYVISKLLSGKYAGLYSFDLSNAGDDVQTLQFVCDLPIRSPATDAAISPDGKQLAVMTVTGPYLFQIDGDVAAAGKMKPTNQVYFDLKDMNMEGVCFVEGGLLATTEEGQVLFFAEENFK